MTESTQMPMCPMAKTCKGIFEKPHSGFIMVIPGVIFIILGVAVVLFPQILVWLAAIALIVMGAALLMIVNFMRNIGN